MADSLSFPTLVPPASKLPRVGTTIFTVMSQLAQQHGAVNLGQGFPDFEPPQRLRDSLVRAMAAGANQYAPMTGLLRLREQIAIKSQRLHARRLDPETEITITSGATEAIFAAIAATVGIGDEVILLDPCYAYVWQGIDMHPLHVSPWTLPAQD